MDTRDQLLLEIRPAIPSAKFPEDISADEEFQNRTLRPIIKMQNDLLLAAFRNYVGKHKNVFYDLTLEKRLEYIENAVQKDMKFRNSLKGMVIGSFTLQEFELYIKNSSALNKRMMDLVKERIKDNIQLFNLEWAS